MKIQVMNCPSCGASLEGTDDDIQFCPYCGKTLYIDDESHKFTYTKVDKARIKEAETNEKIRMKELELKEGEFKHRSQKEIRNEKLQTFKTKAIILGSIAAVIVVAFVIQNLVLKARAKEEALWAYQQAMKDANTQAETLVVNEEVKIDAVTLSRLIEPASELISYKYYYTHAGIVEDSKKVFNIKVPFTTDKAVYLVDGVIGAGADISKIQFDVDDEKKEINVKIPNPKIISHEIDTDSFQYYDVKNSVFNSSNLADYAELESVIKQDQETKLNENKEFWDKTKQNINATISNLIKASGKVDDYKIYYQWYEASN